MELNTTKEALAGSLALVSGAADNKGTVPMLATVLLKATGGRLSMLCSDTAVLARAFSECEAVASEGEIAVDLRRFHDLVRAVPDASEIKLSADDTNTLVVKSGRSRFRLPAHPAADYPKTVPPKAERVAITMSGARLGEMLDQVTPSMGCNDVRAFLNGALLSLQDGFLYLVSTDSFRLTACREPIAGAEQLAKRAVIVPRKTILLARRLIGHAGDVKITIGERDVQFSLPGGTVLIGNGIDGAYPDWMRVIPNPTAPYSVATVDSRRLRESVAMVEATLAAVDPSEKKKGRRIELALADGFVSVSSGDQSHCEIEAQASPLPDQCFGVNVDYVRDAASTIGSTGETVRLMFSDGMEKLTMRPAEGDFPVAVMMPLRG